jgi:hypothetical protein
MARNWIMVRLTRETHAALREVRESMRTADEAGLIQLETDDRDRVSLDQVIQRLIDFRKRHAERRRRAAARRQRNSRDRGIARGKADQVEAAEG